MQDGSVLPEVLSSDSALSSWAPPHQCMANELPVSWRKAVFVTRLADSNYKGVHLDPWSLLRDGGAFVQ